MAQLILTITTSEVICGYSSKDMRGFQLDENCVDPIFRATEANEKPSTGLAKGQSLLLTISSTASTVGSARCAQ